MGRLISRRYVVEGTLEAETPVHIGAAFAELDVDMPLARDGAGRFYIPGTSLAGPIRRWWGRHGYDIDLVFGRIPSNDEEAEGHASYIVVDDAPVTDGSDAVPELRDGVGIDRYSGAAADGIKYDREVLPCGTRFDFRMEINVADGQVSTVARRGVPEGRQPLFREDFIDPRLGALIHALERCRIRFGAAKTRGLGRLKLVDSTTTVSEQVLGTRGGLLAHLRSPNKATANRCETLRKEADQTARALDEIAIEIHWRPELPVMNKSSEEGICVDALPLVTAIGGKLQPVVTGASFKGVLRAHSERICRTLAGEPPQTGLHKRSSEGAAPASARVEFLETIQSESCELAVALFGYAPRSEDDDNIYEEPEPSNKGDVDRDSGGSAVPGLGAISVDDCPIDKPITRKTWEELLTRNYEDKKEEKTGAIRKVLDGKDADGEDCAWHAFRPATHVAIDRWTGGAADGLLFSRIEPAVETSQASPLTFSLWLDPARIARPLYRRNGDASPADAPSVEDRREAKLLESVDDATFRMAAVALFIVTLRELARQRIPIGFGTTRGLGSIEVEEIMISDLTAVSEEFSGLRARDGGVIKIRPEDFKSDSVMQSFEALQRAWSAYWNDPRWKSDGGGAQP